LAVLEQRLHITARVLRDGVWSQVAAEELVPGDLLHVRMRGMAPGDVRLVDGELSLDQSALTGGSLPVAAGCGQTAYASVRRAAPAMRGRPKEVFAVFRTATSSRSSAGRRSRAGPGAEEHD